MTHLTRRVFGAASLAALSMTALPALAQRAGTLKIGYQKAGLPVIARQQGTIEAALKARDVGVQWVEFTAGPPLVEALNVGAIHVGWTGDTPPIFGQSAGSAITYLAALPPNGQGEAVIATKASGITDIRGLAGRRVAVGRGTSSHNLLVTAVEAAGMRFSDIEPVYLAPADAGAAFASGQVDAWTIWDPFLAIAETRMNPTVLVRAAEVLKVNTYFLANRDFAADPANAPVILATLEALRAAATWADANRDKVAAALHEITGVPLDAQTLAAGRQVFGVGPVTPEVIAGQQETAERFFRLGLIPNAIDVRDAVWSAPQI